MGKSSVDTQTRFWRKVAVAHPGECWPWTAARSPEGYGYFWASGRGHRAHRFAYQVAHGAIPTGFLVCHHCDNPPCVNPAHLFLGTDAENSRDKISKRRQACGPKSGPAKLSEQQVREIYGRMARGEPQKLLAVEFHVSPSAISRIKGDYAALDTTPTCLIGGRAWDQHLFNAHWTGHKRYGPSSIPVAP